MKWAVFIWLLAAGMGVSCSIVTERQKKIRFLKEVEYSLRKLTYYMYQWRMPIKEAIYHMAREEKGSFQSYYINLGEVLEARQAEDFGKLWKEQSKALWKEEMREYLSLGTEGRYEEVRVLWEDAFMNLPMEVEELNRRLLFRMEDMKAHRAELEKKYKGEQKLVFAMGIFVSTFFCLIFW